MSPLRSVFFVLVVHTSLPRRTIGCPLQEEYLIWSPVVTRLLHVGERSPEFYLRVVRTYLSKSARIAFENSGST